MSIEIELKVVMILPREGIIITEYAGKPWQGFSLREGTRLNGCQVANLTVAKAVHEGGGRRSDLVSFQLTDKRDAEMLMPGRGVCLEEVDAAGFLDA